MNTILICYQGVSDVYIKEIITIMKYHKFDLAPQYIIENKSIDRKYILIGDSHIFAPKFSAAALLDDMTRREYPPIRYITNKVIFNNYIWKPYFIRCDENLDVVTSCDKCPYCLNDTLVCTKTNKTIVYNEQYVIPSWCPLTDGWRTLEEFNKLWKDYL